MTRRSLIAMRRRARLTVGRSALMVGAAMCRSLPQSRGIPDPLVLQSAGVEKNLRLGFSCRRARTGPTGPPCQGEPDLAGRERACELLGAGVPLAGRVEALDAQITLDVERQRVVLAVAGCEHHVWALAELERVPVDGQASDELTPPETRGT